LRREAFGRGRDFIQILADDGRIDHDSTVVIEGGHNAPRIELEVIRLELIAGQEVELDLGEWKFLGVEHETHTLAAGRLRCVV